MLSGAPGGFFNDAPANDPDGGSTDSGDDDDDGPRTDSGEPSFPGGGGGGSDDDDDGGSSDDPGRDPDPSDDDDDGPRTDSGEPSFPGGGGGGNDDGDGDADPSPGPSTGGGEPSVPGGTDPEPSDSDPDPTGGGANERTGSSSPGSGLPEDELRREAAEQNPEFDPTDFVVRDGTVVVERDEATGSSGLVDERLAPGRRAELTDQARLEAVADANEGVDADDLQIDDGEIEVRPGAFEDGRAADAATERDQATAANDSEPGRLEQLSQQYQSDVVEPAGDVGRNLSPVSPVEEAVFGTDVTGEFNEAAVEGAVSVGNVPGAIVGAREGAERLDQGISRGFDPVTVNGVPTGVTVPDPEGQQAVARDAAATGVSAAETAASNPIETAGLVAGSAATGLGASRLTTGVARRASRLDTPEPAGSFVDDTRAQVGAGRRGRGDTDTEIEQETIEAEEVVGEQRQRSADVEDIPGVRVQNRRTQAADLESELQQMADEADELSGRQRTPRQRAEQRVPDADAFDSAAARQREINRLEERFRTQDMSDLDNRVVPQPGGVDATTAGRFGLTDGVGAAAAVGTATTTQAFGDEPAPAVETEPVATVTPATTLPVVGDLGVAADVTADTTADTVPTQEPVVDTTAATDSIADTRAIADTTADLTAETVTTTTATTTATADTTASTVDDIDPLDDGGAAGGGAGEDAFAFGYDADIDPVTGEDI